MYMDNIKNRIEYKYAKKILNGTYLADLPEIQACQRFMDELGKQGTEAFPYIYDTTRGDRIFNFFEHCANIDATDGTFLKLAEFQYFDLGNIFSWVHKDTGVRRFKEALVFQARGQGKSTQCAVIELYVLCADKIYPPYQPEKGHFELNPNIVSMAVDKEQTKFTRRVAMDIASRSPFLKDQIEVKRTYIRGKKRGGEIAAISKETGNLDGAKLNLIICDEFAAMTEENRINVLRGSFGKREQSLLLKITTAGSDAVTKPAKADYDRCLEILNGNIKDDTYFVMIRQLGENDDPSDFSLYEKCMPMLREKNEYANRLLQQIKDEYNKAFTGTHQQRIEYLIKRTNRWQVVSEEKFLQTEELEMLEKSMIPEEEFYKMIYGHSCSVGYDASVSIDLTAWGFVYNLPDRKVGIDARGFMPKNTLISHKNTDKLPYEYYESKGWLSFILGDVIDDEEIMQYLCDYEKKHNLDIKGVSADRAFAKQILISLQEGRTPNGKSYNTIECGQTTAVLNEACLEFLNLLKSGRLVICENELFLKHCANAYTDYDRGNRMKIRKKNNESPFRIDLLAAVINALRKRDLLEQDNLINAITSGAFSF